MVTDKFPSKWAPLALILVLFVWLLSFSFVITVFWNVFLVDFITVIKPTTYLHVIGLLTVIKLIKLI